MPFPPPYPAWKHRSQADAGERSNPKTPDIRTGRCAFLIRPSGSVLQYSYINGNRRQSDGSSAVSGTSWAFS